MGPDFKPLGTAFIVLAIGSLFGLWKLVELAIWIVSKLLAATGDSNG